MFAGGNLDWDYGMYPNLDEDARRLVGVLAKSWVEGPLKFVQDDRGDKIVSTGSVRGNVRSKVLVSLPGYGGIDESDESEA